MDYWRTRSMDARNRIFRALVPVGLVAASLFIAGPAAAALPSTCAGLVPTIVGTFGDDVLVGTNAADIIDGLGGDDEIHALDGDDIVCGNNGRDTIYGGGGNDLLFGGAAVDTIYGEDGSDEIRGNEGRDVLHGGPRADVLYGGTHADRLFGNGGSDLLLGGHDRDVIKGGFGSDLMYGGNGHDVLRGNDGDDVIVGDAGTDIITGGSGFDRCEVAASEGCEDDLNDAPEAADDRFVTSENHELVGNLFADNGSGPDGDPNADPIVVTAVEGIPISGSSDIALESGASLRVGDDGSFSYHAGPAYNSLTDGITMADGFSYTVADPRGETDDAAVEVIVGGANDAPIGVDDEEGTDEDTAIDIDVLANDADPEEDDLSVVSVDATGVEGTVTVNPDDTIRFVPAPALQKLSENDEVEMEFTYVVADPFGAASKATVTIHIEGANDAPIAVDDIVKVAEDTKVVIDVLANDHDPDEFDELSATLVGAPGHGAIVPAAEGGFTYIPDADWTGVDTFTYEVDDGTGNRSAATVSVMVTPVNDAPTAVDDVAEATPGSMIIILVLANDTDVDGDALEATITNGPEHGSVVVLSNGALAYTASPEFSGIDTITYQVTDAGDATDTATVTITVAN
jgi:VCBS repeat-containing protein